MDAGQERRGLYPPLEPTRTGFLSVSGNHELYYEECGNPSGKPVIVLHGGPGSGTSPAMRRFFDPDKYRIVLLDQRGAGKSRPHASLDDNTTWHLVEDIEQLRETLGIDTWQVFGGSWGSTLALAYAEKHPERVTELVLRGIFMVQQRELDWLYRFGASELFPDAWRKFIAPIPEVERSDLLNAYHSRLLSEQRDVQLKAAKAWSIFEGSTCQLIPAESTTEVFGAEDFALALARIETHYFVNGGFLDEGQLLRDADRLQDIPGVIVHGRYDVLCPARNAFELAEAWPPAAKLIVTADAGHSAFEPANVHELVAATDRFAHG